MEETAWRGLYIFPLETRRVLQVEIVHVPEVSGTQV